jgi:hypothetical protein
MQTQQHRSDGDRLGQVDNDVHTAVRFAVLAAAAGVGYLIVAALWDRRSAARRFCWPREAGRLCVPTASGATTAPGGHGRAPDGS